MERVNLSTHLGDLKISLHWWKCFNSADGIVDLISMSFDFIHVDGISLSLCVWCVCVWRWGW